MSTHFRNVTAYRVLSFMHLFFCLPHTSIRICCSKIPCDTLTTSFAPRGTCVMSTTHSRATVDSFVVYLFFRFFLPTESSRKSLKDLFTFFSVLISPMCATTTQQLLLVLWACKSRSEFLSIHDIWKMDDGMNVKW